eukprot:4567730-Prymnesium_polylepis.1
MVLLSWQTPNDRCRAVLIPALVPPRATDALQPEAAKSPGKVFGRTPGRVVIPGESCALMFAFRPFDELVATGRAQYLSPSDLKCRVLLKGKVRPKAASSKVPLLKRFTSSVEAVAKRGSTRMTANPRRETAFDDEMKVTFSSSLEDFAVSRRDSTQRSSRSRYNSVDYTLEPQSPSTPRFNEPQTPTTPLQLLEPGNSGSQLLPSPGRRGISTPSSRRSATTPFRRRLSGSQLDSETELTAADQVVSGAHL